MEDGTAYICNPSTQKVEVGELLIQGQHGQLKDTLSQNKNNKTRWDAVLDGRALGCHAQVLNLNPSTSRNN